jgi:hypothetical protein
LDDLFQEIRKILCLLLTGFGFFFPDFSGDGFRHSHFNPFHVASFGSTAAAYCTGTVFAKSITVRKGGVKSTQILKERW